MAGTVCPSCSAMNVADQRYCTTCGSALGARCPSCGATNSPDALFCGTCGASLTATITALGDDPAAQTAADAARAAVEGFGAGLDEAHRDLFFARPEVLALRS